MAEELVYDPVLPVAYAKGIVIPLGRQRVTGEQFIIAARGALTTDYDGKDTTLIGLTKIEAANMVQARKAAEGDLSALEYFANRILGKPIQQVNSFNVNTSLKDFLNQLDLDVGDGDPNYAPEKGGLDVGDGDPNYAPEKGGLDVGDGDPYAGRTAEVDPFTD